MTGLPSPPNGPDSGVPAIRVRIVLPAEPVAVRDALRNLFDRLPVAAVSPEDRGTAQIVIAEVLNNIVEHAYEGRTGRIELTIDARRDGLHCAISDRGCAMPGGTLPAGLLPDWVLPDMPGGDGAPMPSAIGCAADAAGGPDLADLPEGGFGWHLIRLLSRDLQYQRLDGTNLLTFHLPQRVES